MREAVSGLRCLFSVLLLFFVSAVFADETTKPEECLVIETVDSYSLFTNKCSDTINVVWFYEGACATGCSDKMPAKYHKYVPILKSPYTIAVCYAPKEVDPKWKGSGPAACK